MSCMCIARTSNVLHLCSLRSFLLFTAVFTGVGGVGALLTPYMALQGVLENTVLPALLQGNVPAINTALASTPSLSRPLNMTLPVPALAPSAISISIALPPAMV